MLRGLDDPNDFDIDKFVETYQQGKGKSVRTANSITINVQTMLNNSNWSDWGGLMSLEPAPLIGFIGKWRQHPNSEIRDTNTFFCSPL